MDYWNRFVANENRIKRLPLFGNYVIANPEPFAADPCLISMSANIQLSLVNPIETLDKNRM